MKLEELLAALWRGDPDASNHLRLMGPAAADAVPALSDAVSQANDRQLRLEALFVLEGLGDVARAAVPAIVDALQEPDAEIGAQAADTLGAIGEAAAEPVAAQLEHDDWRTRQAACQALGAIGAPAGAALSPLLRIVARDQLEVRERAVWALGRIGDERCLEPLASIFTEEGGEIGSWIAGAFGRFGRRARPVADALRAELHRDDPFLALAAASALREIEMHEDAAVWALVTLLHEGDLDVQTEAAIILGEFGSRAVAAVPALRALERADDEELRAQATLSIAKIRPAEALRRTTPVQELSG